VKKGEIKVRYIISILTSAALVIISSGDLRAEAGGIGLPGFGRLAVSFLVISGLMYACIYLIRRYFLRGGGKKNGSMELVGSLTLGQKSKLCIVKTGGKAILIGVTGQQINTLAEFEAEEFESSETAGEAPSFISCLRKSVSDGIGERRSATG
jgi:flagellar protein FliO/FliZ